MEDLMRNKIFSASVFLWIILLASCATVKDANVHQQTLASHCNQQNLFQYTAADLPKALHELSISTELESKLTYQSLNMANAIGILNELTTYMEVSLKLPQEPRMISLEQRMLLLELKQHIDSRINRASLEVSAIASEIDCEGNRTKQVANYLINKINRTESRLTIGAIIVGSTGAILSGSLTGHHASTAVGITTGVAEAVLGLMMLFNHPKIDFYHQRNILGELWTGNPVSDSFPPAVWYYLNYTDPAISKHSIRQQIIDKWVQFGQINTQTETPSTIEIYFGIGGKYTADQLLNRADMHEQLESHITLMKQELRALAIELENIL